MLTFPSSISLVSQCISSGYENGGWEMLSSPLRETKPHGSYDAMDPEARERKQGDNRVEKDRVPSYSEENCLQST